MSEEQIRAAREIAAQCWCDEETKHLEMNVDLAEAFAKRIVKLQAALSAKSVPEVFVLSATNYWKNKNGSKSIIGVAYSIDDAKSKVREGSSDKKDFDRVEWTCDGETISKLVDYDGAGVLYQIQRYAAPPLPTDDERVRALNQVFDNCRVIFFPKNGEYPIEHNPHANKISKDEILKAIASLSSGEQG